jgi:hypothetical protein
MAIRNAAVSVVGIASENLNDQATLATAVSTAISTATTNNAVAGAKANVATELAAITTALNALTANQPSGSVVVSVDVTAVATKNKLRQLLDAAYNHLVSTNILT